MTKNCDIRLEDILQCDHKPITPVSNENGKILFWLCKCGRRHTLPTEPIPQYKEIHTKLTRCPNCNGSGESMIEDTELTCPYCGHSWTISQ